MYNLKNDEAMSTKIYKYIIAFVLAFMAQPMMAQDWMNVYFKDGTSRKFCLKDVKEITTSQFDAAGVQYNDYKYQYVKTHHKTYVYALNDVDSVTFTKYNEEKVKENLSTAIPSIFTVLEDCEDISDVEKNIQQLNNTSGVEKAWSDGHQLFVSIKGWETMSFQFGNDEEVAKTRQAIKNEMDQIEENLLQIKAALSSNGKKLKAAIINQQHYDENRRKYVDDYYLPLINKLRSCNIYPQYFDKPDLSVFSDSIFKYDLVFLVTHGGYVDNGGNKVHVLVTGKKLGAIPKKYFWEFWKDSKEDKEDEVINKLLEERALYPESTSDHIYGHWLEETRNGFQFWVYYPIITEIFLEDYAKGEFENSNSILFNTACQSLKGTECKSPDGIDYSDNLAEKFFNKGLGFYFGYNEENSVGKKAGPNMISAMLNGKSVATAFTELPSGYRKEFFKGQYVYLLDLHNPNNTDLDNSFLIQTHTNQVSSDVVVSQFNDGNSVEVEGLATTLAPESLLYGFVYDTSEDLENPHFVTKVQTVPLTKMLENGNLRFRGTIPDLKPDQTYYYCAYTFDHNDYNYGDTCSFTTPKITPIEDLQIDASSLELKVGESKTVSITSGNGDYTVKSSDESVATASVDGTTVTVKAVSTGSAVTITVTDKSGQKEIIKVTVNAPIPIYDDLVLSSDDPIELNVNESSTFSIVSGSGSYAVAIGNEAVATVKLRGSDVDVSGVASGNTVITVTDTQSGQFVTVNVTITEAIIPANIPADAIDLGLPSGTLWASYNVGATKPEECGVYYAWGETQGKKIYNNDTYLYKNTDIGKNIAGTDYDVAHILWGGAWVMPTQEQQKELFYKCKVERTTINGVKGCKLIGPNGNSIFMPAGGYKLDDETSAISSGNYWSSRSGQGWYFDETNVISPLGSPVFRGLLVRPVQQSDNTDIPSHEAIDLGLPSGTLWASCNMGATAPEEYGDYYAWGETETKKGYGWYNYEHCDGTEDTCHDIGAEICGTKYDVAHVKWGGDWQLPTSDQIDELVENCQHKVTTSKGVKGTLVTGPNGNTIFLPCAGFMSGTKLYGSGKYGLYKSGTRCGSDLRESWLLNADDDGFVRIGIWNSTGHSVRPVISGK